MQELILILDEIIESVPGVGFQNQVKNPDHTKKCITVEIIQKQLNQSGNEVGLDKIQHVCNYLQQISKYPNHDVNQAAKMLKHFLESV